MTLPGAATRPFVDAPILDTATCDLAARVAAEAWALGEIEQIRVGMNGIYRAPNAVLRVSRPSAPAGAALELADFWTDRGLAVNRPARFDVFIVGEYSVTAWEPLEAIDEPVDWRRVGEMIHIVHETDPADLPQLVPLPRPETFPWWDFESLLTDVDDLLDPLARAGIVATIERHRWWPEVDVRVVCHGDVHPGNVVQTADGAVLIDWDLLCWAPPGWDHAPLATWEARWGGGGEPFEAFTAGYGYSLVDDPVTGALAELRLVAATLMRLRAVRRNPAARAEAERRLRYWRGDPDAPTWNAQ